ncbi:hypothetical protein BDR26DRAFT_28938 [Obelidium mucronatum]|nr:hypothetical protein BDR26DRAFT_28938 [Obelidium mucronatum]
MGVNQDFIDKTLSTVFLSAACINRYIFKGIQALQKHCLVSHKSNIKAAKSALQSLRLKHSRHPFSLLQDIQTQVLILAELCYLDVTNPQLCAEFEANNIECFFTGLTNEELARSMSALVSANAKKDLLNHGSYANCGRRQTELAQPYGTQGDVWNWSCACLCCQRNY